MLPPGFGANVYAPGPMLGAGINGLPLDYGTTAQEGPEFVGGESHSKGIFLRFQRRRLNFIPIIVCIALPWGLFAAVFAASSFSIHYEQPNVYNLILFTGLVFVAIAGLMALNQRTYSNSSEREPSWLVFLSASLLIALVSGYILGGSTFSTNMRPYYDMMSLNSYSDIYPDRMRGQQLMDAGRITFTSGTKLDLSRSMGFRNGQTFCVAPIVHGPGAPTTYDFWAVGVNCCSGNQADFHCGNYDDPRANGGLRLMADGDRPLYRLAVQQAEATYKVKAVHPLFFEWVADPEKMISSWKTDAQRQFLMYTVAYLPFQMFLVVAATLAFSKIGSM